MTLLEILTPTAVEKVTFMAALIIAVVWLWWEIKALNRKRDADVLLWRETYEKMMNKLIDMERNNMEKLSEIERNNIKVIEQNTSAFNHFTDILEDVKDKLRP